MASKKIISILKLQQGLKQQTRANLEPMLSTKELIVSNI